MGYLDASDDVHVKPEHDAIEHTPDECVCGATTQPIARADGTIGWMVVHHSLDGRELHEPDYSPARE